MKKLFASLPIIGLILGTIAIATEIRANALLPQEKPIIVVSTDVSISACQEGYLALFQK